jgi:streptogramin lyase
MPLSTSGDSAEVAHSQPCRVDELALGARRGMVYVHHMECGDRIRFLGWRRARARRWAGATALAVGVAALSVSTIGEGPVSAATVSTQIMFAPYGLAAEPGGLWFTNEVTPSIGRITTAGQAAGSYPTGGLPDTDELEGIAAGPDVTGAPLWFANANGYIGRITTKGVVTNYPVGMYSYPIDITAGPDGAMWFTEFDASAIGRISTTTEAVTIYSGAGINHPEGIAAGPDGALWFVNSESDSIGRITTTGQVTNYTDTSIDGAVAIAAGPDGALWFVNALNNSVGRITTAGVITNFTASGINFPQGIAAGPDGAMWFTNYRGESIGRISMTGTVSFYKAAGIKGPFTIAAGPDGAMWFTDTGHNAVGRITTAGKITLFSR